MEQKYIFKVNFNRAGQGTLNFIRSRLANYGPMIYTALRDAFDAGKSITRAKEGVGPWKLRLFWAL